MVNLPEYQRVAQVNANSTGVVINAPSTAIWEQISQKIADTGERIGSELAASKGAQDQMVSGDQPVETLGGMVARALPISSAYQKGADQVFASTKSIALREQVSKLQNDYATDPKGFKDAFVGLRKQWIADGVRADLVAPFNRIADEQQERAAVAINSNVLQRDMEAKAVDVLKVFDANRAATHEGISTGKMSLQEASDRMAETATAIDGGVKGGFISGVQAKKLTDEFSFTIRQAELMKQFKTNGSKEFIDDVRSGKVTVGSGPFLPEQRELIANKLTTLRNQMLHESSVAAGLQAAKLKTMADDDLTSRAVTGEGVLTETQVRAQMFPKNPAAAEEFIKRQKFATDGFHFRQSVGLTSAAEDGERLQTMVPAAGSVGYADAHKTYTQAQQIVQQKWQAIQQDSTGYVLSMSPELRAAYSSPDPAVKSEAMATVRQVQTNMGLGPGAISIIPKAEATTIATNYNALAATAPTEAAKYVDKLRTDYGDNFPTVVNQLTRLPTPVNGSLQVIAQMAPGARAEMIDAMTLAKNNQLTELLDKSVPGIKGTIDQNVQQQTTEFDRTVDAQNDPRLKAEIRDSIQKLAYLRTSRGMSPSEAAKASAKDVIGMYDFVGTLRVPRGTARAAEVTVENVLRNLKPSDLEPQPNNLNDPAYTPEWAQQQQWESLKRSGRVINDGQDGAVFTYPTGVRVRLREGVTVNPYAGATTEPSITGPAALPPTLPDGSAPKTKTLSARVQQLANTPANEVKVEGAREQVVKRSNGPNYLTFKFNEMSPQRPIGNEWISGAPNYGTIP